MAYYRGQQSPRDESLPSNFATNPLSPPRNPNRLGGGMISSTNDARGSLTRRFTTNALPTLTPIGQQRRQAAENTQMVSTTSSFQAGGGRQHADRMAGGAAASVSVKGNELGSAGIVELLMDSIPSPGGFDDLEKGSVSIGARLGSSHRRGKSCWGAIGDGRPELTNELENVEEGKGGFHSFGSSDNLVIHRLTQETKPNGGYSRMPPSERKIRRIEGLLEQQRRIEAELEQVDRDTRREVEEGLRHERSVTQMIAQSEPTTPPEYQDSFQTVAPRTNRYSTNSLTSPPGVSNRANRSSIQLTSPPAGFNRPYTATNNSNLPSQSVPGSRRQSDDEEEEDDFLFAGYDSAIHRAAANPNRNSMPVTSYDRKRNAGDLPSSFDPLNTTSFLFEDEQPSALPSKSSNKTSPPDAKTFLQMQHTADGFPKLIRRGDNGEPVIGSSAALDLALTQPTNSEQQVTERTTASRHRISLPPSALSSNGNIAPLNSILANSDAKFAANNRRSMEVKFTAETKRPSLMASPTRVVSNGVPKAQASYSTNDIPTLKSINGDSTGGVPINSPSTQPSNITETQSLEQNAGNSSRVTSGTTSYRQSQDFTTATNVQENNDIFSQQSGLQAAAPTFGPMHAQESHQMQNFPSSTVSPYSQPSYYGGYGMQMLNNGFNSMNLGNGYGAPGQFPSQMPPYQQGGYSGYQQYPQNGQVVPGAGRFSDNNPRAMMQPRNTKQQADEAFNSFAISDLVGQIYGLCKDQHGCRFLQKKLEENKGQDVQIIFDEVKNHFTELMIDPFGNYLCQRLLEHATDEQRTILVQNAVPSMSRIALNQHGTRALQRMIESISTEEQTNFIIDALRFDVVQLIQDLNGNHVIQKCLNHLSSQDAQFIFDAVGANCVVVGQHRHGCCVLQRCIDHASGYQKGALVDFLIANAFALVQDPFGNYVVQYILDLIEPAFTEPLCRSFMGSVGYLSKQKFSSNVIEKCIRCATAETRRMLIYEILPADEIEKLLRDSFANYVVQTAMDYADEETKRMLIDNIRPILPSVRHTPYGRRIQTKINDYDGNSLNGNPPSGTMSPASMQAPDSNATTVPYSIRGPPGGRVNRMGMVGPPPQWNNSSFSPSAPAGGYMSNTISAPTPQRNQTYSLLNGTQNYPNQGFGGQGFGGQDFRNGQGPPPYGHF